MLIKNNFSLNSKQLKQNIKKTKKIFESFKLDFKDSKIPFLHSYEKNYAFDFSKNIVRKFSKYENIIIVGMGGSILGSKSIYSFLRKKINKKVFFFDNLDSNLILEFKKIKNLKNSCFVIISKSGNTLETIFNLGVFFSKILLRNNFVIITEIKDNNLIRIANKFNAHIIEHKNFIGGRYSVLSEPGMFPAALMGLNIKEFSNLERFINNKKFVNSLISNVASIYTLVLKRLKNSVVLNYNSNFNDLCLWYQQLVGESLGKNGKGITPMVTACPRDHHSLFQLFLDGPKDKFFTFFTSKNSQNQFKASKDIAANSKKFIKNKKIELIISSQCEAAKKVFKSKNIPYRHFVFNENSEKELGEIFTFFVLETILLARMIKVNPFDQPAIEKIKIETKKILSR